MQQLVELGRLDAQHRIVLADQPLLHHVDGDLHRGPGGALAVAGLQHVELALLDGELDVLHVAVVVLEDAADLHQLLVALGHHLFHGREGAVAAGLVDRLRGADAGDHVLALGVDQELAVEVVLAGSRVAGEGDAGGAVVAHVAEDHRLNGDRGPPLGGDVVEAPVGDGAGVHPGAEDGADGAPQLLGGVLGEVAAELGLDLVLEQPDQFLEVGGGELGILVDAALLLHLLQEVLEDVAVETEDDVGIHLDEAPVGVVGETLVAALGDHPLHGLVVETEVEDGVHHPRHRGSGAGAHRDQQRVLGVAEGLAHQLFDPRQVLGHFLAQAGGVVALVLVELGADLGGDGEAGRHRQPDGGHLRQVGALAAEQVLHLALAFGLAVAEEVHVLGSHQPLLLRMIWPGASLPPVFPVLWMPEQPAEIQK